jgi:uncharacterized sulfatase
MNDRPNILLITAPWDTMYNAADIEPGNGLVAKGPFMFADLIRVPFIVRHPGAVEAGRTSSAMQSLVDLAPTFLDAAGIAVPGAMQGVSQLGVWRNCREQARDRVVVEHRHQPTRLHLRTYVTRAHKLTCYRNQTFGELFDLENDPGEVHNRWDDPAFAAMKSSLLLEALQAEIEREPTRLGRIAHA